MTNGPADVQRSSRVYVIPGTTSADDVAAMAALGRASAVSETATQTRLSIPTTKTQWAADYKDPNGHLTLLGEKRLG
jgi:hypothetical protein